MASSWKSAVSMSTRITNTMKIMSACKSAFPDSSPVDTREKARHAEDEAFNSAESESDYQKLWQEKLDSFLILSQPLKGASTTSDHIPSEHVSLEQIGPYKASHHASGITATVYRSVSPEDNKAIAIKVTTPDMMSQPHNSHREARLLRKAAHETVVPLISTQSIAGGHFALIFPFLPLDLDSLIKQRTLTTQQTTSHLRSLFAAVDHIHSLGILHRDIKPSNILLVSPSGPAYLADFGIAWHADDVGAEPANEKITDVGTTHYRPPELLFGNEAYGPPLDLWAAGCVVAEALSGRSLFDAGDLGSELALIKSIFQTLGTPDDDIWPEAKTFRDWGKVQFTVYPSKSWDGVIPNVASKGKDLVAALVKYQSTDRLTAKDVLQHPFFSADEVGELY